MPLHTARLYGFGMPNPLGDISPAMGMKFHAWTVGDHVIAPLVRPAEGGHERREYPVALPGARGVPRDLSRAHRRQATAFDFSALHTLPTLILRAIAALPVGMLECI